MFEFNQDKFNQDQSIGHGGARRGAGRKAGSITKKTRAIAEKVAENGITPLEVMVEAMRNAYASGGAIAAFPFAKDVAPYLHARIAAMELSIEDGAIVHEIPPADQLPKDPMQLAELYAKIVGTR